MRFNENLRSELIYNDIKVKELSYMINVPYSTVLSYIDKRSIIPNAEVAVRIAKVLNVSVEYLVTGKKDPLNPEIKEQYPLLYTTINELHLMPRPILIGIQKFIHLIYSNINLFL